MHILITDCIDYYKFELNPSPFVKKLNKKISKQNSGISVLAVSAALKETTNSIGIEKYYII